MRIHVRSLALGFLLSFCLGCWGALLNAATGVPERDPVTGEYKRDAQGKYIYPPTTPIEDVLDLPMVAGILGSTGLGTLAMFALRRAGTLAKVLRGTYDSLDHSIESGALAKAQTPEEIKGVLNASQRRENDSPLIAAEYEKHRVAKKKKQAKLQVAKAKHDARIKAIAA